MRHNHTLNQRNKAMKLCYRAWEQVKNKIEVVIQGAFIKYGGGEKPSSNYDSFSPIMKKTKSKSDAKVKTFA